MRYFFHVFAFVVFAVIPNAMYGQKLVLGVLEDIHGQHYGEPNYRSVRAVFQKKGADWEIFRSSCTGKNQLHSASASSVSEVNWTIAFDGKNLGQVTTLNPNLCGSKGQSKITSNTPVPTVGKREYQKFLDYEAYRPLIVNSKPFFNDPDMWKPVTLAPGMISLLHQQFRKKYPKLCRMSKDDQSKLEAFSYDDNDLKLVKAYGSAGGWMIAQLHLDAIDCNDTEAGFNIDDAWFAINAKNSANFLGTALWLVDAGDYNNDGKSEIVFALGGENRGGYELFYDDFEKHVVFEYSLH